MREIKDCRILNLRAENFKRISVVDITPTGDIVEIAGKNGHGKTSVLDAIAAAIEGKDAIQLQPIRKGWKTARVRVDLGDLIITRTFKEADGKVTTSLKLESPDGATYTKPQTILDSLLSALAFDPLAFTRMPAKDQFDALKKFVPDFDFEKIEGLNRSDTTARTEINRQAQQYRAQAAGVQVPENAPVEKIDESALLQEMEHAGQRAAEIERERAHRDQLANFLTSYQAAESDHRAKAEDLRRQAEMADSLAVKAQQAAAETARAIEALPPLPDPVDTSKLRANLEAARAHNAIVDKVLRRQDLIAEAEIAEAKSDQLTADIAAREKQKRDAVAAAKMPIQGLAFGDGVVLLNEVPFDQASDAEQLRASIAIAAAMNSTLRVIRVRDGSLLDDDSFKLLAEFARDNKMQVWVETVGGGKQAGAVVMEDGHVKGAAALEAAE